MKNNSTKKIVISAIVLAVLIALFALLYGRFSAKSTAGDKAIVIEVVDESGNSTEYDVDTDAEYLKDAMDDLADEDDSFATYSIYIMREGDTIEKVIEKYGVTKDDLLEYNDLSSITMNSKVIVPTSLDE